MWTVPPVVLREGDREELQRRVRAHKSSQRQVRRAQVVLMAADGVSNRQIAMAVGIDQIYVGVWRKRLKPHLVRGWLNRKDSPEFWDRAADVCGLYLSPPIGALVLSIDEKTAIAARSRQTRDPTCRARPA